MTSLRRQLFAWLLSAYVLTAAAAMWLSYNRYESSIDAFMDRQMSGLAQTYDRQSSPPALPALPPLDAQRVEHDGSLIVQLWDEQDRLVSSNWPLPSLPLQTGDGFRTLRAGARDWRVYTLHPPALRVQVVQSESFRRRVILSSAWESVQPIAFLIPVSAVLLGLAVLLALRPVDRLVQAIGAQDERHLTALPLAHVPRELGGLIAAMNGLLARLRDAFALQQRSLQDAAHELRTPLTAVTLRVEGLRHRLGDSAREELRPLEDSLQRLQRLVEQMLRLARQEAGHPTRTLGDVDLEALLKESIERLIPLAERRRIDLGFRADARASAHADADDLRNLFDNLLDNALRYTPIGGSVDVELRQSAMGPVVELIDDGPGVPPELLGRVCDRFFRVPGNGSEGSGLGLAIATAAARRHGLRLEFSNRDDRSGLVARVAFPGPRRIAAG